MLGVGETGDITYRSAKSYDKAEDLLLLESFMKIFCFSDLFTNSSAFSVLCWS